MRCRTAIDGAPIRRPQWALPYRPCFVRRSRWRGVRRCRWVVPGTSVSFAVIRVAMLQRPRWMLHTWLASLVPRNLRQRRTCLASASGGVGTCDVGWTGATQRRSRHAGAVHLSFARRRSPADRRRRMAAATQGKRPQGVACISSARCRAYGQARQRSCAAGCRRGGRGAPAILPRLQRYLSNSCWRTATTQVSSVSRCSSALLSLGLPEPRSSMDT
ncbi:putative membrane protein [Xanthomonas translucens pv. arrhenatheri LMG 727]|uniref:Putative membrane protein n=1 Tax=Xanthomonas graminis pv. arrhenatheri LMG 727 TaxID=1195923 RepID=A0A0K3A133_9XANT|nr:putative membrane protein [Xanthomonas translucens pv. arrhenatheri LMG 727]